MIHKSESGLFGATTNLTVALAESWRENDDWASELEMNGVIEGTDLCINVLSHVGCDNCSCKQKMFHVTCSSFRYNVHSGSTADGFGSCPLTIRAC